jgi:hypothetical protein
MMSSRLPASHPDCRAVLIEIVALHPITYPSWTGFYIGADTGGSLGVGTGVDSAIFTTPELANRVPLRSGRSVRAIYETRASFLKLVRNARNCVEHPKPGEQVIVKDFELNDKMQIVPPLIEIIHPKTPQPEMHMSQFDSQVIEQISNIF